MEERLIGANTLKEVFPELPGPEKFEGLLESFTEKTDRFAVLVLRIDDFDKTLDHLGENITSSLVLSVARIIDRMSKTIPMIWGRLSQEDFGCLCRDMDETSGLELAKEIQNHVRTKLAAHEYPREIEFVNELPLTTTGKLIRRELRKIA